MQESIFKNLKLEGFQEISCTKNISDYGDRKSVTISLEYTDGYNHLKIGSTCERLGDNSLDESEPVKILYVAETVNSKTKLSHRAWNDEINDIVKKDLDIVDELFNNFCSDTKRVYL